MRAEKVAEVNRAKNSALFDRNEDAPLFNALITSTSTIPQQFEKLQDKSMTGHDIFSPASQQQLEGTFKSEQSSRLVHLKKRSMRLQHKLKKLQMCQLSNHVSRELFSKENVLKNDLTPLWYRKSESLNVDYDYEMTDGSSEDDEDCDNEQHHCKGDPVSNPVENKLSEFNVQRKQKLNNEFVRKTASVYNKWQWIQLQIENLENKISQTNCLLQKVRSQESRASFNSEPVAVLQDETVDETLSAARVRALKLVNKKKLASTLSIVTQSQNTVPLSGTPCDCPRNMCCIMCGGPGVLYLKHPDRSCDPCSERIDTLYSKYHRILSAREIPLSAQYGRLIKEKRFNSKNVLQSGSISADPKHSTVKKPNKDKKPNNHLQKLLEVKKKSRKAAHESDSATSEVGSKDRKRQVTNQEDELRQNEKTKLKQGQDYKSQIRSSSSSPLSITNSSTAKKREKEKREEATTVDDPYIPDLSESSSSGSDSSEEGCSPNDSRLKQTHHKTTEKPETTYSQRKSKSKTSTVAAASSNIRQTLRKEFLIQTKPSPPVEFKVTASKSDNQKADMLNEKDASKDIALANPLSIPSSSSIVTATAPSSKKPPSESDSRADNIVIPLSNSLPFFEPVVYKNIETPQWRTKWLEPLPLKNVGAYQQRRIEDMSLEQYSNMHNRYEREERIKSAGMNSTLLHY